MLLMQEIRACDAVLAPPLTGKGGRKGKPMGGMLYAPLLELMQVGQHGQRGRLGGATAGHHGLLGLHRKA